MEKRTQGQVEAEFTKAMIRLEKEYLGRGPLDCRTYFVQDMILVRLRGILTPAEQKLAETQDGRVLVKESRRQLFETSRPLLDQIVKEITGVDAISMHTDMSTRTGERVIVLTVSQDLSRHYRERK